MVFHGDVHGISYSIIIVSCESSRLTRFDKRWRHCVAPS